MCYRQFEWKPEHDKMTQQEYDAEIYKALFSKEFVKEVMENFFAIAARAFNDGSLSGLEMGLIHDFVIRGKEHYGF